MRSRHNQLHNDWCWDKFIDKMRSDSGNVEWGNESTAMAFSLMYNLTVKVVFLNSVQGMSTIPRPEIWDTALLD